MHDSFKGLHKVTESTLKNFPKNCSCEFCGHPFKIGDRWGITFSNSENNYNNNPLTCETCFGMSNEIRLLVWRNMHDIHLIFRTALQAALDEYTHKTPSEVPSIRKIESAWKKIVNSNKGR